MRIGIVSESTSGETRVAATPTTVAALIKLGYQVAVESGAGAASSFADSAFSEAGADIVGTDEAWAADIVFMVDKPSDVELDRMRPGAVLVGMLSPRIDEEMVARLATRPITALSMDAVPRISRAQSMDVLSSMANIAGYRAVIEAANRFGRLFTGQVTAAGKVPPAKVLVAGAGVAGLAAIGTAGSLGAIVYATDPRPEVADQVKSLGGEYLSVTSVDVEVSSTGYAKEMSDDYNAQAAALYAQTVPDVDVVITTALIPGRPAPKLLTAEMVASMRPGSVIVDMAASQGGNVAGTVAGEVVTTDHGVTIIGYTDLAGRLPAQASQLYGTNLVNLMKLLTPDKDGTLVLDFEDPVQRGITVVRDGESTWPPPPVQVSAAPAAAAPEPPPPPEPKAPPNPMVRYALTALGALGLFLLLGYAPDQLRGNLTVFVLAVVIGYYVIGNVAHALHTPLMSVTNAISGIVIVGAMLQVGHGDATVDVLAAIAMLAVSINVFGGFAVTRRMLSMFSRE